MSARKRAEYRARFCPDDSDTGFDLCEGTKMDCTIALSYYARHSGVPCEYSIDEEGLHHIRLGAHYGAPGSGSGSVQPMPVRVRR